MMLNAHLRLVCGARISDDIPPPLIMGTEKAEFLVMQPTHQLLCMFAKLQKVTVSFVMSVQPHVTTWLPLDKFL